MYRLIVGMVLLIGLYLEQPYLIYGLIGVVLFEGITNLRIPVVINKFFPSDVYQQEGTLSIPFKQRFNFEAERAWRLLLGIVLIIVYVMFYDIGWPFAWFMAFAIVGAGLSGVCPLFMSLKWLGFR